MISQNSEEIEKVISLEEEPEISKEEKGKKNIKNEKESQECNIKNIETFSFMDENEKNDNSTFFEIETLDKVFSVKQIQSENNLNNGLYQKIPYDKIRAIIQKDNVIYKRKNNITPQHYNKRIRYLGKKIKRDNLTFNKSKNKKTCDGLYKSFLI